MLRSGASCARATRACARRSPPTRGCSRSTAASATSSARRSTARSSASGSRGSATPSSRQACYRLKARLQALGVPALPRLAHRLAMALAQVSIGDPVVVAPGLYILHGQVVVDGLVEIRSRRDDRAVRDDRAARRHRAGRDDRARRQHRDRRQGDRAACASASGATIGANAVVVDDVPAGRDRRRSAGAPVRRRVGPRLDWPRVPHPRLGIDPLQQRPGPLGDVDGAARGAADRLASRPPAPARSWRSARSPATSRACSSTGPRRAARASPRSIRRRSPALDGARGRASRARAGPRDEPGGAAGDPAARRADRRRRPQLLHRRARSCGSSASAPRGPSCRCCCFHDVCWPHGRRDDYFDAELIPEESRHPVAGDARRDRARRARACTRRGLPYPRSAAREGGARNGVLAAVEDFVAARDDLRLAVVPAFFGLRRRLARAGAVGGRAWPRSSTRGIATRCSSGSRPTASIISPRATRGWSSCGGCGSARRVRRRCCGGCWSRARSASPSGCRGFACARAIATDQSVVSRRRDPPRARRLGLGAPAPQPLDGVGAQRG